MAGGGYELGDITGEDWGDALLIAAVVAGTAGVGAYAMAPAAAGAAGGGAAAAGGTAGGLGAGAGLGAAEAGVGLGAMEAGLGGTSAFLGPATAGGAGITSLGGPFATMSPELFGMTGAQYEAGVPFFTGIGPETMGSGAEASLFGGELGIGAGGYQPGITPATGTTSPWYSPGNLMSTQNLQKGVMMGMLGQMGGSLFSGGDKSAGPPPAATVPQIGSRQAAQPTALGQLGYLQSLINARRNRPGIFG